MRSRFKRTFKFFVVVLVVRDYVSTRNKQNCLFLRPVPLFDTYPPKNHTDFINIWSANGESGTGKVQKCFESRLKVETEQKKVQTDTVDAVEHLERRARVVRLVESSEAALAKAFAKNEKLLELAKKSNDPTMTTLDLEKWLGDVTAENDAILKKARD